MENQKTQNNQDNIKEEQSWGQTPSDIKNYYKAIVNKTGVIGKKKKKANISIKQNRESRNKPTDLWQTNKSNTKIVFQQTVLGTTGHSCKKKRSCTQNLHHSQILTQNEPQT